jgi:acyl-CoA synthetase (AMP-forming)/AMP-acid ligase II
MIFDLDEPERRDRIALTEASSQTSWNYGQLSDEVQQRRDFLLSQPNASQPRLVFHFCGNDLQSVGWYLACLEARTPVVLLSGQLNPILRNQLISLYRPDWIIDDSNNGPDGKLYNLSGRAGVWRSITASGIPLHPELALLLSTSGSTGSPKLVRLTRNNLIANARSICEGLCINSDHFPVAHLPLHYSYGLSVLNSHLLCGARILLSSFGLMTGAFWHAVRVHQANSFSGVPYTYQMLRRLDLEKLGVVSLHTFTQAGGKLDTRHITHFHEQIARRRGNFWVMYGQTEATARMTILPAHELSRKMASAGKAIPRGRLSIRTEEGKITSERDVTGELLYEGPNVMMGYAQVPEDLGKGDELHGHLETGDRAFLDEEGFVYIIGRTKRDAKLFGLRVNLDDLEAFVKRNGPAAAVSTEDRVVIFCEFGSEQILQNIRNELAAMLRINTSAFQFRRIDQLPTVASGKIDYEVLQNLL